MPGLPGQNRNGTRCRRVVSFVIRSAWVDLVFHLHQPHLLESLVISPYPFIILCLYHSEEHEDVDTGKNNAFIQLVFYNGFSPNLRCRMRKIRDARAPRITTEEPTTKTTGRRSLFAVTAC